MQSLRRRAVMEGAFILTVICGSAYTFLLYLTVGRQCLFGSMSSVTMLLDSMSMLLRRLLPTVITLNDGSP